MQHLSFYNVMAPHLLITYFCVYTQSQPSHVNHPVVRLLLGINEREKREGHFFMGGAGGSDIFTSALNSLSFLFHLFVHGTQSWTLSKWKQISCFGNQSFKWTLKWVGVLRTPPVIFSLLCTFRGHDPSTELPLRGAAEGCADGRNGLIKESEEIWGGLLR